MSPGPETVGISVQMLNTTNSRLSNIYINTLKALVVASLDEVGRNTNVEPVYIIRDEVEGGKVYCNIVFGEIDAEGRSGSHVMCVETRENRIDTTFVPTLSGEDQANPDSISIVYDAENPNSTFVYARAHDFDEFISDTSGKKKNSGTFLDFATFENAVRTARTAGFMQIGMGFHNTFPKSISYKADGMINLT